MFDSIFRRFLTTKNFIFILMVVFIIFCIVKMQDIAIMFFASYVIACSLNPLVEKLERKNMKRHFSAAIVLSGFLLVIAAIIVPVIILVGGEIKAFSNSLPSYFHDLYNTIVASPLYGKLGAFQLDWKNVLSSASSYTSYIFNDVINFGINFSSGFVYFVISLIMIYYFMADKKVIDDAYLRMFPKKMRKRSAEISEIISQKIGGYIVALAVTALSVAVMMVIGLMLFKVNYGALLGIIVGVLDIIPVIGPAVGLVICLLVSANSGMGTIMAIVGVFAVAQLIENNFIRPYIFGKFLDIHPIMIFLFLLITAKFIGPIGVIFAPAIAATVCVLIEEIYMKHIE